MKDHPMSMTVWETTFTKDRYMEDLPNERPVMKDHPDERLPIFQFKYLKDHTNPSFFHVNKPLMADHPSFMTPFVWFKVP